MNTEELRDKFAGALLGTFVGDALGAPVEGWPPDRLRETLDNLALQPPGSRREMYDALVGLLSLDVGGVVPPGSGRYTDDTQMTIGLAESLAAVGNFDGPDLARRFADNFEGHRGYGPGAYRVLLDLKKGAAWDEAGQGLFGGQGSFGNGAAMRVAPAGVMFHDNLPRLRRVAEQQARITHTHVLGMQGAVWQAAAVAAATRLDPEQNVFDPLAFLDEVTATVGPLEPWYAEAVADIRRLLAEWPRAEEVANVLGSGIEAHESVPAALYSFLANPHGFADAVRYSVLLGGDADTIGAMTGAIAGAYHGASAIPAAWLAALENGPKGRDYVRALADDLFAVWRRRA